MVQFYRPRCHVWKYSCTFRGRKTKKPPQGAAVSFDHRRRENNLGILTRSGGVPLSDSRLLAIGESKLSHALRCITIQAWLGLQPKRAMPGRWLQSNRRVGGLRCLTAEFGMGSGVSLALWPHANVAIVPYVHLKSKLSARGVYVKLTRYKKEPSTFGLTYNSVDSPQILAPHLAGLFAAPLMTSGSGKRAE